MFLDRKGVKMNKNIKLLIISGIGIIAIIIGIILAITPGNSKKEDKKEETKTTSQIKWEVAYGSDFDKIQYDVLEFDEYSEVQFNSYAEDADLFTALTPTNTVVYSVTNNKIQYRAGSMNIECFNGVADNKEKIISNIKEEIEKLSEKYLILKAEKSDLLYVYSKVLNGEIYEETLYIFKMYQFNGFIDYSSIYYKVYNNVLSDKFINDVIGKLKIEKGKAEYSNCVKNDDSYTCDLYLSNSKKLTYTIDAKNYKNSKLEPVIKNVPLKFLKYTEDPDKDIEVNVEILYGIDQKNININNNFYEQSSYKKENKKIDNLDFLVISRYNLENDIKIYYYDYYYFIDSIQTLHIYVVTPDTFVSEVINDFTNFSIN